MARWWSAILRIRSAALSGGGPISVRPGGTLGGYGSVTGPTVNNGVIAAGSATPGFLGSPTGTFTIIGDLLNHGAIQLASGRALAMCWRFAAATLGAGGSMDINTFLGGDGSPSDRLVINGGAADREHIRARDQRWRTRGPYDR